MTVRYYQAGDERQIQALYRKVFKKERSIEEWDWKFKQHPDNLNPFILVYEEDNTILGHIALWVADAYVEGSLQRIALRVDTMVDPDTRGKGIYKLLNHRMLEAAKESGLSYLYGFPASKAKELIIKTTPATYAGDISRYMNILNPVSLAISMVPILSPFKGIGKLIKRYKLRHANPPFLPAGWKLEEVDVCDERFDQLADDVNTLKPIILKRDAQYLNWRYAHHPEHDYQILALTNQNKLQGYVVLNKKIVPFKKGQATNGYIIDYLAYKNETVWELLVKGALANLQDTDLIQLWGFPDNIAFQTFERFGFKEKDRPMSLLVHDLENHGKTDHNNWWITQGDVDSF